MYYVIKIKHVCGSTEETTYQQLILKDSSSEIGYQFVNVTKRFSQKSVQVS